MASKTLAAIRAPDEFVYVAPFNLIEGALIAPLEYVLPKKTYTQLNRRVMAVLFFLPMSVQACRAEKGREGVGARVLTIPFRHAVAALHFTRVAMIRRSIRRSSSCRITRGRNTIRTIRIRKRPKQTRTRSGTETDERPPPE